MDPLDHYSIDGAIEWINNEAGDIHMWINTIGGFIVGIMLMILLRTRRSGALPA